MIEFFNVKTDWAVFVFMIIAWSTFIGLKVIFEYKGGEESFWKTLVLAFIKTSPIVVLFWFLYAFHVAQFDHNPWPLNLMF